MERFWGLSRRCVPPKRELFASIKTLSWCDQLKNHFKFSTWFFHCLFNYRSNVNSSGKAGLWLWIFRGDFFFFSLYRFPSLGQVYFWYTIVPAGIGIWGSRFVLEDVWLDNIHLFHLNLDFVSCVLYYLQKQNCKVTRFDTFHRGESRWSTWHLAGFQAFTLFCSLRISTFLGQRWFLLIKGVF